MTKDLYIRGWKDLARVTGYHPQTLRNWHYTRARVPFNKTHPYSSRSRWIITLDRVHIWLAKIGAEMKAYRTHN
jgi:hypothetical protein